MKGLFEIAHIFPGPLGLSPVDILRSYTLLILSNASDYFREK